MTARSWPNLTDNTRLLLAGSAESDDGRAEKKGCSMPIPDHRLFRRFPRTRLHRLKNLEKVVGPPDSNPAQAVH